MNIIESAISLISRKFNQINDMTIKSDEENLDSVLRNPEDRRRFNEAVQKALNESKPVDIELNGRLVTIIV